MPDEPTPTTPQAGDGGQAPQPQAGNTTPGEPQVGEPQSKPSRSADEYERMIAELRKENASARVKAKELDDLRKQIEEEKLSEKERLERRLAEAQKEREQALVRAQEGIVNAEIKAELAAQGLRNPKLARLIDRERIEFDDNGNPTNIADLIADVLKEMPELKGQSQQSRPASSGGATNPARSQTSAPQEITRDYVNGILKGGNSAWQALSPEEQGRISAWIKGGGLMRR